MKVCFPVLRDEGGASTVYGHFASAPLFLVLDTATGEGSAIANCAPGRPFAGCDPFSALRGRQLDGIVVDAIGDDAVRAMNLCGFTVYRAASASVAENLRLLENRALPEVALLQSHREGRCSTGESGCNCGHRSDLNP